MAPETLRDRLVGCLVGGALGDAWGGPYEGRAGPLTFVAPSASTVSDDTELTLATCEAILARQPVSAEVVAKYLLAAYRAGRVRGIGASTLKAMRDLDAGAHWALAGARGEFAAGNGAAMRAAPLAFVLDPEDSKARGTIRDVSRITHHSDEAYVGSLAVIYAVRAAARGEWASPTALDDLTEHLPEYSAVRERLELLLPHASSVKEIAGRFGSSGWVVDSVPIALYAARRILTQPLGEVLGSAIEAGGDTDTVASIAGQICGAHLGVSQIPSGLLEGVVGISSVLEAATHFARSVKAAV